MPLRDFQVSGSTFLRSHNNALLLDDAGLGKSAMVLDAADKLGLPRILCVGPAVAGVSWPQQIAQWSPSRDYVDAEVAQNYGLESPGFYFVSFDLLSRKDRPGLVAGLTACSAWDLLVIDEGQYLKNFTANRTRAVYNHVVNNARRVWVLSGTLAPNHAGEVYPHLRMLFPDVLAAVPAFKGRVPEQFEFENRYCDVFDGPYGRAIRGSRNQRELRAAMAPFVLRRRKAEVMPELPPMDWFTAPLAVDPAVVRDIYATAMGEQGLPTDPDMLAALSDDDLVDFLALHETNLSAQRRSLGLAKVPAAAAWVQGRIEAGEKKILVFAHHTAVLAGLRDALLDYGPVVYQGSTPPADRHEIVRAFQIAPDTRVFIGQIQAAGTAITLTAAKTVFFAEYASTPGVNYQAASRAHRLGQRDGVQVYFGSVPKSLDEKIARTAARRAREVAELFD